MRLNFDIYFEQNDFFSNSSEVFVKDELKRQVKIGSILPAAKDTFEAKSSFTGERLQTKSKTEAYCFLKEQYVTQGEVC